MYKLLTREHYNDLNSNKRLYQLRKWLEDQLENHRSVLRSIAGTIPESDPDIEEVIGAEFNELGQLINEYEDSSAAKAILTYRLENNIMECDDSILDIDAIGIITSELCRVCESEGESEESRAYRSFAQDMVAVCRILCFNDLEKSFEIWCP